jgi:hypothetical protein
MQNDSGKPTQSVATPTQNEKLRKKVSGRHTTRFQQTDAECRDSYRRNANLECQIKATEASVQTTRFWQTDAERRDATQHQILATDASGRHTTRL